MRHGGRYEAGADRDYVKTRPILPPTQVDQVQTLLNATPSDDVTYPQLTADQNDYPLLNGVLHRFSTDALRTITGFANPGIGGNVIVNVGSQDLVLANNNAGSIEANRILTHTGGDITLGPNESALVIYDRVSARVRTIGF